MSLLRLTLLRHATAEAGYAGQSDFSRLLEPSGQRDAQQMAHRALDAGLRPDLILTSPANRTLSTATIMAQTLNVPEKQLRQEARLYLAEPGVLMQVIRDAGGRAPHLMVVGHNPGLTVFAEQISARGRLDHLPTCGLYTLLCPVNDWAELEWASGIDARLDHPGVDPHP